MYGVSYWIVKWLVPEYFTPFQLVFFRVSVSFIVFFILQKSTTTEKVRRHDLFKLALYSLLGIALNQTLFINGVSRTTPVDASIIHVLNPILVLLFASLIIKEKINFTKIVGVIFGALGAVTMIAYHKTVSFNQDNFIGNMLILCNLTSYALFLVLSKPIMKKYKTLTVMMWLFFFGVIYLLPFSYKQVISISPEVIPLKAWLALAYIVFGTTVLTYLFTMYALKFLSASVVSYYIYIQPIVVGIITIWILHENITLANILSTVLIFVGVYLVSKQPGKNPYKRWRKGINSHPKNFSKADRFSHRS